MSVKGRCETDLELRTLISLVVRESTDTEGDLLRNKSASQDPYTPVLAALIGQLVEREILPRTLLASAEQGERVRDHLLWEGAERPLTDVELEALLAVFDRETQRLKLDHLRQGIPMENTWSPTRVTLMREMVRRGLLRPSDLDRKPEDIDIRESGVRRG